jgi:ketosteroid isomerase-like protein
MFSGDQAKRSFTLGVLILLLSACMTTPATLPSTQSATPPAIPTIPNHTKTSVTILPTPTLIVNPVSKTVDIVKGFAAAWNAYDPDRLLSYYSKDVKSFDATSGGIYYDYLTIDNVLHHDWINGQIAVKIASFFVSGDGHFAATVGTFTQKDMTGKFVPIPYISILEFSEGKIIWVYDYYGGISNKGFTLQDIPVTANQPALSDQVIIETRAMIVEWEAAYNNKDPQSFLSFYDDQVKYTEVIAPEWLVFTKDALIEDVLSKFGNSKFFSVLKTFFVSPDGHFVAVQGIYDDEKTFETPMVILLEVENGLIINQFDYFVYVEIF